MPAPYNASHVQRFFDECGLGEWPPYTYPADRCSHAPRIAMPREHIAERNALEQSPLPPYHFGEFAEPGHACGGEIVTASAANVLSLCMPEQVAGFENAPALRERFIAWEGAFCPEPGAIDAGTHIIAAVRHRGLQLA